MRCIWYSNENGREGIYVTEDDSLDTSEVLPPNCTVQGDFDPEVDGFPSNFCFDRNLEVKI
jgi:hypothetical protein